MVVSPFDAVGRHADRMNRLYDRIENVHKRKLHSGQIQIGKDYFTRGMAVVQSQWGRNAGKTEGILFLATVACLLNDNFWVMIVAPELKQGRKIYWAPKRLQNYPPPEFVSHIHTTDMRVEFPNGSIITVEGCENFDGLRGVKPNLVFYDEFQHHSKEFHLEVMQPNLLGKDSSLLVFGTPPKMRSAYYVEFRDELLKSIKAGDATASYYEFPTSINPSISPEKLAKIRKQLIESGNEIIWYREYEGRLVFGGEDAVFPKWNPEDHCTRHQVLMSHFERARHTMRWYTVCDPASSSVFGVLFLCYNPYTQKVYVMDEIYEKDRNKMDSRQMWERIRKKEEELYPNAPHGTWKRVYDEQAAWFAREIQANYRVGLTPTLKQHSEIEDDVSKIKILMAEPDALLVSDRCYWLRWEIESFVTDAEGRFPKHHDHLIDCFRYFMQISNWKLIEKADESLVPVSKEEKKPVSTDPGDWANQVVDNSLWIPNYDIYSEYFD